MIEFGGTLSRLFRVFILPLAAAALSLGCTTNSTTGWGNAQFTPYIPGGATGYFHGLSQSASGYQDIAIAEESYGAPGLTRTWAPIVPVPQATGRSGPWTMYYKMNVRWRLKNGAEYIVQDVDLSDVMYEYFRNQRILMPWEIEKRPRNPFEDFPAVLGVDIMGDAVQIKWTVLRALPMDAKPSAAGVKPRLNIIASDYVAKVIRGRPVQGLDFTDRKQFLQP